MSLLDDIRNEIYEKRRDLREAPYKFIFDFQTWDSLCVELRPGLGYINEQSALEPTLMGVPVELVRRGNVAPGCARGWRIECKKVEQP